MKVKDVESALFGIPNASTAHIALVLGLSQHGALSLVRVQITDEVAAEFRQLIEQSRWWDSGDVELRAYDPGYKPDDRDVVYAALDSVGSVKELVELCASPSSMEVFDGSDESVKALRFYVIVGGTKEKRTLWIRSYSAKKELSRSATFAMMHRKGSYDVIHEDVFIFDSKIDCIVHDGYVFIQNVAAFERVFNLVEEVKAKAGPAIQKLCEIVDIANAPQFQAACQRNLRMAMKAVQIVGRPYSSTVTMKDIERTIKKHNLDVTIEGDKLVFDNSPSKRWLILKVLDDAFLDSSMTGLAYETNSKAPLA